jgi:hypothetical protein
LGGWGGWGGCILEIYFEVLNLSLPKLKYSYNVKDVEFLKCLIRIECFILQLVSDNAELKADVSNIQPDDPNDNQQVQSPVDQPEYGLEQVHASPDEHQQSFPHKFHRTPKSSGTSCSKKQWKFWKWWEY